MIFQHTHDWIFKVSPATGQPKTQTRRIVKPGQRLVQHIAEDGSDMAVIISSAGKRLHYVGQDIAVQPGRTMKGDGHVRILEIKQQDVRNITNDDARAEGFYHALDFLITWCGMHDIAVGFPRQLPTQASEISRSFFKSVGSGPYVNWVDWTDEWLLKRPDSHYQAFAYRFIAIEQE